MMRVEPTGIQGCFELKYNLFEDIRGIFLKTFNKDAFYDAGLKFNLAEEYYTLSKKGVLRGLHFQSPPMDHVKIVYTIKGKVLDVVLDIRQNSPSYGKHIMLELEPKKANALYIPKGVAHGFYVPNEDSIMVYKVSTVYSPDHDSGIRWDSAGIDWPDKTPVISERDLNFIEFKEFETPFRYEHDY